MDSERELYEALKENLESSGSLRKVRAEVKSEIMKVFDTNPQPRDKPELPESLLLINSLIQEYLEWNGYMYTSQILAEESGMTSKTYSRQSMQKELQVSEDENTRKLPLLCSLVSTFKEGAGKISQ
ncbi:centrosomal protein 20-like isoform X2 [Schistocerca cancellata]|uniref:centrosomal protein 20-like isoform X2 n=1 Tax=Schistocerca cancellata TaxID=274614 RepID=UPI00211937B7|nr:centrosomal protein 20-like isoform X2 [Schistocerca cancellata]